MFGEYTEISLTFLVKLSGPADTVRAALTILFFKTLLIEWMKLDFPALAGPITRIRRHLINPSLGFLNLSFMSLFWPWLRTEDINKHMIRIADWFSKMKTFPSSEFQDTEDMNKHMIRIADWFSKPKTFASSEFQDTAHLSDYPGVQWQPVENGIVTGCTTAPLIVFIIEMNLLTTAATAETKRPDILRYEDSSTTVNTWALGPVHLQSQWIMEHSDKEGEHGDRNLVTGTIFTDSLYEILMWSGMGKSQKISEAHHPSLFHCSGVPH